MNGTGRAAVEICIDKRSISRIEIITLISLQFVWRLKRNAKNENDKIGFLSRAVLQDVNISIRTWLKGYGLFINSSAHGSLVIKKSVIPELEWIWNLP